MLPSISFLLPALILIRHTRLSRIVASIVAIQHCLVLMCVNHRCEKMSLTEGAKICRFNTVQLISKFTKIHE